MPLDVVIKVKRQKGPQDPVVWETFNVPAKPGMNVISALMEIQRRPVNTKGEASSPVVWDSNCLEEVCGACTMVINGRVRQACSALVEQLEQPIVLEPMTKFPLVRDLIVDRSRMFEGLKQVGAWVSIDGTWDMGAGPRQAPETQEVAYDLSRCMTCGCCLEACPNVNAKNPFIGPAAISQVRLFNLHPTGRFEAPGRLEALMGEGGIHECGNAQNCAAVCPKEIPLTTSIAAVNRDVAVHAVKTRLGF